MDIFARRERYPGLDLGQTGLRLIVGKLCRRFATRVSLYEWRSPRVLSGCCGLVGSADFPFSRGGPLLDYFRSCAGGRVGLELPPDSGIAVWCCIGGRILWSLQRKLDANHSNDGA